MADWRWDVFKGIRPRISPRLLPEGEAQTAENLRFGTGSFEPWDEFSLAESDVLVSGAQAMHKMVDGLWLSSASDVDYARGPVPNDELDRTYYTGESEPRMTYVGIADDPDYRILGIPAPTTAPAVDGEDLPTDTVTGTSTASAISTNYMHADVSYSANWSNTSGVDWYMVSSVGGYESPATVRVFNMDFYIGQEMRVVTAPDANTVTLEDAHGGSYLARSTLQDRSHPTNNFRDADTGTTRAAYFRFYMPNGTEVTLPTHTLQVGDVIRITSLPETIAVVLTQAATGSLDGVFFGATTSGQPGYGSSTWPAGVTLPDDGFYVAGGTSYPFVEVWSDIDGAVGTDLFSMNGQFTWELIERDGVSYEETVANVESRVYVYTFVSELGEEGPPSPASEIVTIPSQGSVELDTFDTPPSTNRNITNFRIYRANTGNDQTIFQFVAEIDSDATTYTDTVLDLDLGEILQTESWEPPDSSMVGITALPNGGMAGFFGKTVALAEPFYPHAWPPEYQIAVDYDVVGLGIVPNGVAILTTGPVYIASGDHPRAMSTRHFNDSQSCLSKRSIANTTNGVIYAAPDGLAFVGSTGFQLLTEKYTKKREWQEFNPSSFIGFWHDQKYIAFSERPAGVIELLDQSDETALAASPTTLAYPLPAGTDNRLILVAISYTAPVAPTVTVSYGGVTMTDDTSVGALEGAMVTLAWLSTNGQSFGNDDVVITGMGSAIGSFIVYVFDNVDPDSVTTPLDYNEDTTNTTTNFDVSLDVSELGDLVFVLGGTTAGPILTGEATYAFETLNAGDGAVQWSTEVSGAQDVDFTSTTDATDSCIIGIVFGPASVGSVDGIVFDPYDESIGLSTLNLEASGGTASAGYLDSELDELQTADSEDTDVYQWEGDPETKMIGVWKSGKIVCPYPLNLGAARIVADSYDAAMTLSVYNDQGDLVTTRTITSDEVIRLPSGYLTNFFEVELTASEVVRTVHVAETVDELLRG